VRAGEPGQVVGLTRDVPPGSVGASLPANVRHFAVEPLVGASHLAVAEHIGGPITSQPKCPRMVVLVNQDLADVLRLGHEPDDLRATRLTPTARSSRDLVVGVQQAAGVREHLHGYRRAAVEGHEHRAITYQAAGGVRYPRCLGHGSVPVLPDPEPPPGSTPATTWQSSRTVREGGQHRTRFGFVVAPLRACVAAAHAAALASTGATTTAMRTKAPWPLPDLH